MLGDYANQGGQVFVDSGAFPAFQAGKTVNWPDVMRRYDKIVGMTKIPANLHLVFPDVVGDQVQTLALQEQYSPRFRSLIADGVTPLIPVQKGALSPYDAWTRSLDIYRITPERAIAAVPSNQEAFSETDLKNLISSTERPPTRVHLLGLAANEKRLEQMVGMIPGRVIITTDANRLRAKVGKGRPVTEKRKAKLHDQVVEQLREGQFDETELIYDVVNTPAWMNRAELTRFAKALGLDAQAAWDAHQQGTLNDLIETVDPEGRATMDAIWKAFRPTIEKAEGPKATTAAIAEVFKKEKPLDQIMMPAEEVVLPDGSTGTIEETAQAKLTAIDKKLNALNEILGCITS